MSNIYDLPPAPRGTTEEQLTDLRNYLFRLSGQLSAAADSPIMTVQSNSRSGAIITPTSGTASSAAIKEQLVPLRELIIKTAKDIKVAEDRITSVLKSEYVANSTFGEYRESAQLIQEQTAARISENYEHFSQVISSLDDDTSTMFQKIQGQIQRGYIEINGQPYFGIAISDRMEFGSGTMVQDGETYREIVGQINCGLYTATGWMFFLNNQRAGWFDSTDGLLHVEHIYIESSLRMGNWLISTGGKWGLRYIGGE